MKRYIWILFVLPVLLLSSKQVEARFDWGSYFNEGDLDISKHSFIVEELDTDPSAPSVDNIKIYAKDDGGTTKIYTQDSDGTVQEIGSGGGSGDVTGVGDCADGACLDGTSDGGSYIRIYDGDSHYAEINPGDLSANRSIALRDAAGTLLISGDTLTGDVTATFDTDGSTATTIASDAVDDTMIDWGSGANQVEAEDIPVSVLGTTTYTHIQHAISLGFSAGVISGGAVTDSTGGEVDVAAGTGWIKASDSDVAEILFFNWSAEENIDTTDDSLTIVGIEYNDGSPQVVTKANEYAFDLDTNFPK